MKLIASSDQTVLDTLLAMSPSSSKTTLRSWIKEGRVAIDGRAASTTSDEVKKGQAVTVGARKRFVEGGIRIVYEDQDLIVIDKPCGLLSVATAFEKGDTAHGLLKAYMRPRKVFVVHRLDQETSGVMVFALNENAYTKLKKIFEKHDLERRYTAIVEGNVSPAQGTWESYLYEDANYYVHSTDQEEEGELAITHYQVKQKTARYTWLEVKLETGKKNQIRVHCKDAGHPVVGDKKYGTAANPLKRLCLHAHLLAFRHPVTTKPMTFTSEVPEGFWRLLGGKKHV